MDYASLGLIYSIGIFITFVITILKESDAYDGPGAREFRLAFTNSVFWPLIVFKWIIIDFIKIVSNWK